MNVEDFKQKWVFVLLNVLFITSLLAAYFYFFPSIKKEVETASEQLGFEQRMLKSVQENVSQPLQDEDFDMKAFQRQVPVKPLVDQFIFDLEKAEVYSDSFISSYSFASSEYTGTNLELPSTEDEEELTSTSDEESISDSIERVTVNLSVTSPEYENLIEFLRRIEQLERITKVDNISFTGLPEQLVEVEVEENQIDDSLNYSIVVSTFYLPELVEYEDDLPMIPYPEPSEKENPFFSKEEKE